VMMLFRAKYVKFSMIKDWHFKTLTLSIARLPYIYDEVLFYDTE
jgi:hypothetical protein